MPSMAAISASNAHVLLMADRHLTLLCQRAYIRLQGGHIEFGCPGNMTFRASNYHWMGAVSEAAVLPQFELGKTQRRFVLTMPDGIRPAAQHAYRVTPRGGGVLPEATTAARLPGLVVSQTIGQRWQTLQPSLRDAPLHRSQR